MKLVFSSIRNSGIFEDEFNHLPEEKGTIEFKRMRGKGGIAVVYAPNGTGKTSLARLLSMENAEETQAFQASDERGNRIAPEDKVFHVIEDHLKRNIIHGETTDYLMGAQIRREYELHDEIESFFKTAYERLYTKYKTDFKVSKVKDYLLDKMKSSEVEAHQTAYQYIRSIVNTKQRGQDIDKTEFIEFIRNEENRLNTIELDNEKKSFIVTDLSKAKLTETIISINPEEIIPDEETILIEQHDDAIGILNKYHVLDSCIVCDNRDFNRDRLLEIKSENRKVIYDRLDEKTKKLFNQIVGDSSLNISDPFNIKEIVKAFIVSGDKGELVELQREIEVYVRNIENEMLNTMLSCFDGMNVFESFDEYKQLIGMQPQFDSEELLFIESVINENIGKDISIIRDEENDRNYKLKIGNQDLLGTDRIDMELSTGEQNFISLAFELLLARHSDKDYIVMDDPISSFDSVYKNKIAFCIIKFLENKKQIILTHNTDLIRLLDVQYEDCFNLYILSNVYQGENGFILVSNQEKKLLINLHHLVALFQNKNGGLTEAILDQRHFLMSMIPFMRGYVHISLDPDDYYGKLSTIMHGYNTESLDIIPIYNKLFGTVFEGEEIIGISDILEMDYQNLSILDEERFPLLADTLEQSLIYYHIRMKVEKELVDIFNIQIDGIMMLNDVIMKAFNCPDTDQDYEKIREFRVFFTSRKTLLNEFNHFEGNMNIFQPAIDITKSALQKEIMEIESKLEEVREFESRRH